MSPLGSFATASQKRRLKAEGSLVLGIEVGLLALLARGLLTPCPWPHSTHSTWDGGVCPDSPPAARRI